MSTEEIQEGNKKITVALLAGGHSPEGSVAVLSGKYVAKIFEDDEHYQTYLIHVNKDGWYYEDTKSNGQPIHIDRNDFTLLLSNEEKFRFDLAVLLIGGSPGEDGQIQGYPQIIKVPFVGCGLLPSGMLCFLRENSY